MRTTHPELRLGLVALAMGLLAVVLAIAALLATPAAATTTPASGVLRTGLPNRTLTPGALNPAVTQATIKQTICVSGWTATVRPPATYTTGLKRTQLVAYGFADRTLSHYEEDHLISLELGGSPRSPSNLWPEPHSVLLANGTQVGSFAKDAFETYLKRQVCAGHMSLATAQHRIAVNWVYYWRIWKGSTAGSSPSPSATPSATPAASSALAGSVAAATSAGATAVCNDGTWSYSQTRSGTCSYHGGVYWWTGKVGSAGPG